MNKLTYCFASVLFLFGSFVMAHERGGTLRGKGVAMKEQAGQVDFKIIVGGKAIANTILLKMLDPILFGKGTLQVPKDFPGFLGCCGCHVLRG